MYHRVSPGGLTDDPVQLDDSENWTITAYWYTEAGGVCQCAFEEQASVTYAVTHSGTGWSGTCTGCNAMIGPIYAVTICDINADNCSSYDDDYRLSVNVAAQNGTGSGGCGGFARFIERVEYSVTNIDDGDAFNASTCNLGAAVTPTQNTFSATDVGAFECPYNCSQVGSSLSIVYQ